MTVERVRVTNAAEVVIRRLQEAHGDLLFHQSGGCCDGSAPMCYPRTKFHVGAQDVYLGAIADVPVILGRRNSSIGRTRKSPLTWCRAEAPGFLWKRRKACGF